MDTICAQCRRLDGHSATCFEPSNLNVKLSGSALPERVRHLPVGPPHGVKTQLAPGAQNHPKIASSTQQRRGIDSGKGTVVITSSQIAPAANERQPTVRHQQEFALRPLDYSRPFSRSESIEFSFHSWLQLSARLAPKATPLGPGTNIPSVQEFEPFETSN
jgi:hypothetical protein